MQGAEHPFREILKIHRPLVQRIVAITSRRRHLSEAEENELSRFVVDGLDRPDRHRLGTFRGRSSVASYLVVCVQRLYRVLIGGGGRYGPEPTPVEDAIRRTSSLLTSREALVLKMWFESGMTTQKISRVLGILPEEVHAVIAERTGRVQQSLAESRFGSSAIEK